MAQLTLAEFGRRMKPEGKMDDLGEFLREFNEIMDMEPYVRPEDTWEDRIREWIANRLEWLSDKLARLSEYLGELSRVIDYR
jgi:hypothetical protein